MLISPIIIMSSGGLAEVVGALPTKRGFRPLEARKGAARPPQFQTINFSESDPDAALVVTAAVMVVAIMALVVPGLVKIPVVGVMAIA